MGFFSEIIADYDFWGIGDIDIVYGDIRSFINDEILNEYDVISSRHDYITGSFIGRRVRENNRIFSKSVPEYTKRVF